MTNAGKIEEATPRPWIVLDDHPIKAVLHIVSAENNTDVAASVYGCDGYQDQDGIWRDQHKRQATAELIVRAVNAHEGLVKALEKIIRPHDCGCQPCTGQCESEEAAKIWKENTIEIARAALKQSEGTQ